MDCQFNIKLMTNTLKSFFGLILLSLFLFSCEKETSEENGLLPGSGGNAGGGGNNNAVCKSCSYIPWCSGSTYTYVDTSSTGASTSSSSLTILSDTTIAGVVYSKTSAGGNISYHNCSNGVTTLIAYNASSTGGTTLNEAKTIMLKANEPLGTNWTSTINNNGTNLDYKFSIIAKSVPRTVLGVNYPDVIHVHLIVSTTVPVIGTVVGAEGDYYYARNVGLIENISYDGNGTMTLHRVLQSYQIP